MTTSTGITGKIKTPKLVLMYVRLSVHTYTAVCLRQSDYLFSARNVNKRICSVLRERETESMIEERTRTCLESTGMRYATLLNGTKKSI